jgi:hypothetical protein
MNRVYNQLMDHILNKCDYSFAKDNKKCQEVGIGKIVTTRYIADTNSCLVYGRVLTFTWEDKFFFLTTNYKLRTKMTRKRISTCRCWAPRTSA